jgi:hypothetical protein
MPTPRAVRGSGKPTSLRVWTYRVNWRIAAGNCCDIEFCTLVSARGRRQNTRMEGFGAAAFGRAGKSVLKWVRHGIQFRRLSDRRLQHAGRYRLPGRFLKQGVSTLPAPPSCSSPQIPSKRARHLFNALKALGSDWRFSASWLPLLNPGCHCWLVQQCPSSDSCLAVSALRTDEL